MEKLNLFSHKRDNMNCYFQSFSIKSTLKKDALKEWLNFTAGIYICYIKDGLGNSKAHF